MSSASPLVVPGQSQSAGRNPRAAYEVIVVMVVSLLPGLIWPQLKGPLQFLPIIYLLVDRSLRHHTWGEIGLDPRTFVRGLRLTWPLVLLVAVGTQALMALTARAFWPALFSHILERLPLFNSASMGVAVIVTLLLGTFFEELIYRGLFQGRLGWLIGGTPAVVVVALLFGLMHIAPGNPAIVAIDVLGVVVDGLIYGAIFARSRNLYVSWLAHFAADVVGLGLLLLLR